jgi:hypothetical protein
MTCGQNQVLDADLVGCGRAIAEGEVYRCVECKVSFHRECARKHFNRGEIFTQEIYDEQCYRWNLRQPGKFLVRAISHLSRQQPRNTAAVAVLEKTFALLRREAALPSDTPGAQAQEEELCAQCGKLKNDSTMHHDAPGTNWGAALHWFQVKEK